MKASTVFATVVTAVAAVSVAVICLVCTDRVVTLCNEKMKEAQ